MAIECKAGIEGEVENECERSSSGGGSGGDGDGDMRQKRKRKIGAKAPRDCPGDEGLDELRDVRYTFPNSTKAPEMGFCISHRSVNVIRRVSA